MPYSPTEGSSLSDENDFKNHQSLAIPVDVEEIEGEGIITTGFIQNFDEKMVVINDHSYNRHVFLFISRPNAVPAD
jgi:hypothetical protein